MKIAKQTLHLQKVCSSWHEFFYIFNIFKVFETSSRIDRLTHVTKSVYVYKNLFNKFHDECFVCIIIISHLSVSDSMVIVSQSLMAQLRALGHYSTNRYLMSMI